MREQYEEYMLDLAGDVTEQELFDSETLEIESVGNQQKSESVPND